MGFSFVHAADLHLDSPFKGFEQISLVEKEDQEYILKQLRESTFAAFFKIVDLCLKRQVDFLLLSGDIFDAKDKSLKAQLRLREGLQRLAEANIPTFIVHGNHDPASGWWANLSWPESVHFFSCQEVESRPVIRDGHEIARVYGISYPTEAVYENYVKRFRRQNNETFSIAMLHCNTGSISGHENYSPCSVEDLREAGFDYWALGHVHSARVLNKYRPCIIYPGNSQGRNSREAGPKGCYFVTVSETGEVWPEFIQTDFIRWINLNISIEGLTAEQEILDLLETKLFEIKNKLIDHYVIVRLYLTGRGRLHRTLKRADVQEGILFELRNKLDQFIWPESLQVMTGLAVDKQELKKSNTFLGDLLIIAEQARESAQIKDMLLKSFKPLQAKAGAYFEGVDEFKFLALLDLAEELAIDLLFEEE